MSNFSFLAQHDAQLAALGARAEAYALDDPNTALVKLRQFLERFVVVVASLHRSGFTADDSLHQRLLAVERAGWVERATCSYAHKLRMAGNRAVHDLETSVGRAVEQLRNARRLAIWLETTFGDAGFHPGRFIPPAPPADASRELQAALARQAQLEAELEQSLAAGTASREALNTRLEEQAARLARPQVMLDQSVAVAIEALDDRAVAHEALHRFRDAADPATLEPFASPIDPSLRWTPLTDRWVLVVAVAPDESILLALWAGDEDGASAWAASHRVEVNAATGHIQVFRPDAPVLGGGTLFAHVSDADLLACGVPPVLLPAVRALDDEPALAGLTPFLPPEAAETLLGVVDGLVPAQAQASAGLLAPRADVAVDPNDFATAVAHPATQRRFVEVVDDEALAAVLDAPLSAWRTFLHPTQRRLVRMRANGPVRVLGGAGTGKTVALLHRAVLLARERVPAPERVLVTTFSRTLADELALLVHSLAPDVAPRIDVTPLHRFARRLLVLHDRRVYDKISDAQRRRIVAAASREFDPEGSLTQVWLLAEWRDVLVRFGVRERDDYLRRPRVGRGKRIGRRQRALAWTVLSAAAAAMEAEGLAEPDRLAHDATQLLSEHPEAREHSAILADEAQDFSADALRLLRAAVAPGPDDLFLVGDGHQRLYGAPVPMTSCGIAIRGRSARLRLNYRTTEAIRVLAHAALGDHVADDLDGGQDSLTGYRSLRTGAPPQWEWCDDRDASHACVADLVDEWAQDIEPDAICVAARSRKELSVLERLLVERGLDVSPLDQAPRPGVRLSTFHRLKGTEYARVVLASVCAEGQPLPTPTERCLLYVAATRARDRLALVGWGAPSPLLTPELH